MTKGSSFEAYRDGEHLACEVVWTGGMSLLNGYWPSASSLKSGEAQQPAKGVRMGTRHTPAGTSQTKMRA